MEKRKLVGYHTFKSKAGENYYVIDVIAPVTTMDKTRGFFGPDKVESLFITEELWDKLSLEVIGKTLMCTFEVSNGRAYLVNFEVIEEKK